MLAVPFAVAGTSSCEILVAAAVNGNIVIRDGHPVSGGVQPVSRGINAARNINVRNAQFNRVGDARLDVLHRFQAVGARVRVMTRADGHKYSVGKECGNPVHDLLVHLLQRGAGGEKEDREINRVFHEQSPANR